MSLRRHGSPARVRAGFRLFAWVAVFGCCAAGSGNDAAHTQTADGELPSWRTGQPLWNGSGYSLPAATGPGGEDRPTTARPVHREPFDPAAAEATVTATGPSAWSVAVKPASDWDSTAQDSTAQDSTAQRLPTAGADVIANYAPDPSGAVGLPAAAAEEEIIGMGLADLELLPPVGAGPSEAAAAEMAMETPPLEEDVRRWYEYPLRWFSQGWANHAEFGLNGSQGNARTLALQTGLELKRKTDISLFAIDLDYRRVTNRSETTESNGRFNTDYDRFLGESSWTMFGKLGMEWDEFKAFDLRLNLNSGVGYHWIRSDTTTFVTRFGAGSSRMFGAPIDRWTPEAVFGAQFERQLTARQKIKAKVDYFPAWADFSRFRVVSDLSWEMLLDGTDNLSLKLAVTDRYDSEPQGARPHDLYYSMLLLYKF